MQSVKTRHFINCLVILALWQPLSIKFLPSPWSEMEKAADAVDAVRANFFYRCAIFMAFESVFQSCLPFLCNFWHFC